MIYYQKHREDLSMYLKELIKISCKPYGIIGIAVVPLTVYFLIIGYLVDKEALIMGYSSLAIFILMFVLTTKVYFFYKKMLTETFKDANKEGVLEFSIDSKNNFYIVRCVTTETVTKVKKSDIKKTVFTKKIICIKNKFGQYLLFPRSKELEVLFKNINTIK